MEKLFFPHIFSKMYLCRMLAAFALAFISDYVSAQDQLRPGFDKAEYTELFQMHVLLYDSTKTDTARPKIVVPPPAHYQPVYRSPIVGLDNKWGLWKKNDRVAAINVRGTTLNPVGWLENFYAAMVPARGELKLSGTFTFPYRLADHPKAAVHIGWLVGTAFLARDILPKVDSMYQAGTREFLIMGHSQGGAIAYLLTAHLYSLQSAGKLAKDIRFKTYCSAAPKVGNTFFGYEYEHLIDGGWGYNVVNAADWIPEVPFSVQTLNDFNETNPFKNIDGIVKKQKLIARVAMKHAYKKMRNPSMKARRNYIKYLGNYASKSVKKVLPEFVPPIYANTSNYVRIGPTITLLPDEAYYRNFPDSEKEIFVHHLTAPYLYLIERYKY
ncbi:lipase family protein [Dyadobacter sp.]|uniref:lipase family protein n=1 Tax=Dyadobacter sp. TaxID=1914288 RepID=UPI003F72D502